jgi:pimeloyl-ACP methyl ester carboxylesterase
MQSHISAPTQYVTSDNVRYAFRRFGSQGATPILLLQHFTGGMDHWDPKFTDGLAAYREVILFDNAGIGGSGGETPKTIEEMAVHVRAFVVAIGIEKFDLLGFSMGGMVAQAYTERHASTVRKLILVGTSPRGGDPTEFQAEVSQRARGDAGLEEMAWLFFGHSEAGQKAAAEFWERRHAREVDIDPPTRLDSIMAQVAAGRDWLRSNGDRFADLRNITVPTLVANGSRDVMLPTINSFYLQQNIPNAQLIIYPDAGHAPHFQYPDLFLAHAKLFLEA